MTHDSQTAPSPPSRALSAFLCLCVPAILLIAVGLSLPETPLNTALWAVLGGVGAVLSGVIAAGDAIFSLLASVPAFSWAVLLAGGAAFVSGASVYAMQRSINLSPKLALFCAVNSGAAIMGALFTLDFFLHASVYVIASALILFFVRLTYKDTKENFKPLSFWQVLLYLFLLVLSFGAAADAKKELDRSTLSMQAVSYTGDMTLSDILAMDQVFLSSVSIFDKKDINDAFSETQIGSPTISIQDNVLTRRSSLLSQNVLAECVATPTGFKTRFDEFWMTREKHAQLLTNRMCLLHYDAYKLDR